MDAERIASGYVPPEAIVVPVDLKAAFLTCVARGLPGMIRPLLVSLGRSRFGQIGNGMP